MKERDELPWKFNQNNTMANKQKRRQRRQASLRIRTRIEGKKV